MERELKDSLNSATVVIAFVATISSLIIIFSSIHIEKSNFFDRFSRLVAIDFAQLSIHSTKQAVEVLNLIDKYNLISRGRYKIHSTEIFDENESGDFIYATYANRVMRFKVMPESSYFRMRIVNMAFISFFLCFTLIYLIRLIFIKLVFKNFLESNKLLNKMIESSYSSQLTQVELIDKAFELQTNIKTSSQLRTTHKLLRRFSNLPQS